MKNTILKYTKIEVDDFVVSDYFSKKINISDFVIEYPDLFSTHKILNDDKLENISYNLYGTTDYWDLLLMLNNMDPLFDMPLNDDAVVKSVETKLNTYFYFTYSHAPLSDQVRINELTSEFSAIAELHNERFRYILIVKPNSLSAFIKILKDNSYI